MAVRKKRPVKKKSVRRRQDVSSKGWLGKSALCIAVYGPSGVGKTSFAAQFPRPGFIVDHQETGILTLQEYGLVPDPEFVEVVRDFKELHDQIKAAIKRDINTLVIESLWGIEKQCFDVVKKKYYSNSEDQFWSFWKGPKTAAKRDWPAFIDALIEVYDAGINVIITAHSVLKPNPDPDQDDLEQHVPYMERDTWQCIHRWARAVLFYNTWSSSKQEGVRRRPVGDTSRFLYTQLTPTFAAKNQYGLKPVIDAGDSGKEAFDNFLSACKEVVRGN